MKSQTLWGLSSGGFHRLHLTEWGDIANPRVLICAHGLTRCGRDFDTLARKLAADYRIFCPDTVGRGESDWLANKSGYDYAQYMADAAVVLAHTGAREVHWIGTSMGGILGMVLAALPRSPITRLVVNDVGFHIPKASLERIGAYLGQSPAFQSLDEVIAAVRKVSPFGNLSEMQWRDYTVPLVKQGEDGLWRFRYDPGIGETFRQAAQTDIDLSAYWQAIRCPVLLTRGAESDLLLHSTFESMCAKPGVRGIEFPNVGHAPMFHNDEQIDAVREFLLGE